MDFEIRSTTAGSDTMHLKTYAVYDEMSAGLTLNKSSFAVSLLKEDGTKIKTLDKSSYGKDMITLVTCTPFSINTHRLLVTGERYICQSTSDQIETQAVGENSFPYGFVVLLVVVVTLTVVLLSKKSIRKKEKGVLV